MKKDKTTLEIGNKINIYISNQKYKSQVVDIINENNYIILGPIKYGKIVQIPNEKEIKIMYSLENHGRMWFDAMVKNSSTKNVYRLLIKKISDLNKVQEREYYRLRKIIDIDIITDDKGHIKSFAEDISGEGMKIVTKEDLDSNNKLKIKFILRDKEKNAICKIVRKIFDEKTNNYYYGLYFESITKRSKEDIIRFIFEEQRIMRKKGLY